MFQRKSKPEQVRKSVEAAGDRAASGVGSVAGSVTTAFKDAFDEKVAPKMGPAAENARERGTELAHQARERAERARDRAVSSLDHQIDVAVPKGQEALAGVAPKVDHARDVIVDDLLPKLSELLGNVQSSKNEVLSRTEAPIAAVTGAPKKKKRKGGALLVFGLAAAAGAAVAYYLNSQKKPPSDPWATDRPVGGAPGVDTQVRSAMADKATATSGGTSSGAAVGAATTTAATTPAGSSAAATGSASDTPIGDSLSSQSAVSDDDEIPGTNDPSTSGFGTDFGAEDTDEKTTDPVEDEKDSTDRKTDLP